MLLWYEICIASKDLCKNKALKTCYWIFVFLLLFFLKYCTFNLTRFSKFFSGSYLSLFYSFETASNTMCWNVAVYYIFWFSVWKDYSQERDKKEHNDLLPDVNSFSPQGIYVNDRYSTEQWIKDLNIKNKIGQEIYLRSIVSWGLTLAFISPLESIFKLNKICKSSVEIFICLHVLQCCYIESYINV